MPMHVNSTISMFISELQNQYLHLQVLNISFFNFFPTVLFAYEKLHATFSMPIIQSNENPECRCQSDFLSLSAVLQTILLVTQIALLENCLLLLSGPPPP